MAHPRTQVVLTLLFFCFVTSTPLLLYFTNKYFNYIPYYAVAQVDAGSTESEAKPDAITDNKPKLEDQPSEKPAKKKEVMQAYEDSTPQGMRIAVFLWLAIVCA